MKGHIHAKLQIEKAESNLSGPQNSSHQDSKDSKQFLHVYLQFNLVFSPILCHLIKQLL
jgi:hypothetical protein